MSAVKVLNVRSSFLPQPKLMCQRVLIGPVCECVAARLAGPLTDRRPRTSCHTDSLDRLQLLLEEDKAGWEKL